MSPRLLEEDWDLTPVIDLIYSLSVGEQPYVHIDRHSSSFLEEPHIPTPPKNGSEQVALLGNFDKIWQHLGQPKSLQSPSVPPVSQGEYIEVLNSNDLDCSTPFKAVKWRDELEGAELADNDESYDSSNLSDLTKAQRKKVRRKQRHKAQAEALPSGSEDDSGKDGRALQMPDRRAIIHQILHGDSTPDVQPGRLRSGKLFRSESSTGSGKWPVGSPHSAWKTVSDVKPPRDSAFALAAAKKSKLIAMLAETFLDERQYLSNFSFVQHVGTITASSVGGVHIFVDASNVRSKQFLSRLLPF